MKQGKASIVVTATETRETGSHSVYVRARMESVAVKALKGAILKFPDKAKDSTNYPKNFISSSDNTHDGKYFWRQRDKTWLILH